MSSSDVVTPYLYYDWQMKQVMQENVFLKKENEKLHSLLKSQAPRHSILFPPIVEEFEFAPHKVELRCVGNVSIKKTPLNQLHIIVKSFPFGKEEVMFSYYVDEDILTNHDLLNSPVNSKQVSYLLIEKLHSAIEAYFKEKFGD